MRIILFLGLLLATKLPGQVIELGGRLEPFFDRALIPKGQTCASMNRGTRESS
ncbi:MAG: hypothetical protein RI910_2526 [Verrucomicrobiota bacterium]